MYETQQEANQKLQTCIVSYDGSPFYVSEAEGSGPGLRLYGMLCTVDKTQSPTVQYSITDPKWEFKNLGGRLGYVNIDGWDYKSASYVRRVPVRAAQRTQGLSRSNVKISRLPPCAMLGLTGMSLTWDKINKQAGFFDTWAGTFPDIRAVRTQMKRHDVTMRALGRFLAVQRSPLDLFYLLYKGEPIGRSEDLEVFKVPKQFRYLDELLIEDHNLKIQ